METSTRLDDAVLDTARSIAEAGLTSPQVLFLLGTGLGTLPSTLGGGVRVPLGATKAVPTAWRDVVVHAGRLGALDAWLVEDSPGELEFGEGAGPSSPAWERSFPCWLGAACGARVCVHTSAGLVLDREHGPPVGTLAVVSDHINVSGRTPLLGLGETRFGPLFPDQSRLHHEGLRRLAIEHARARGIPMREAVAACTLGPALTTPAECAWLASTGAQVAVQGLAEPLIACAHAGLAVLALVAITDTGVERLSMAEIIERSENCAPALEDLITALTPALAQVATEIEEQVG